jgi:periplasmic protein TonB
MAAPDPLKPIPSTTQILRGTPDLGFEADFADLAARFAAKSGGGLSPELSAELALEIVLNEIVEQACQITGATGAAIVIERDGELVCRASGGSTAPELGSRIDKSTGLSAESLRTRKTLWCDDTFTDSRAEQDSLKQLGIRSVVIMPLLRGEVLVGIFELFSTQAYAFGVRDERTLEMLADRTLTNLDHASQPFDALAEPIGPADDLQQEHLQKIGVQDVAVPNARLHSLEADANQTDTARLAAKSFGMPDFPVETRPTNAIPNPEDAHTNAHVGTADLTLPDMDLEEITPEAMHALLERAGVIAADPEQAAQDLAPKESVKSHQEAELQPYPKSQSQAEPETEGEAPFQPGTAALTKQVDYISWALGFAIVSVAVLLGLVLGQHFVLSHPHLAAHSVLSRPTPPPILKSQDPTQAAATTAEKSSTEKSEHTAKTEQPTHVSSSHDRVASPDRAVPPGGLLVLENGKEVFRLPPVQDQDATSAQQVIQPASELQADPGSQRVLEVPEATAQRELLHRVEPEYPQAARAQNIEGKVILEVHIGADGSVQDVETVSGSALLAQASTDAVKQWKFKPRVIHGQPTEMQTRVTFDFKLSQ